MANSKHFTNDFSQSIWETTYKLATENSIADTWKRVADAAASVEKNEEDQLIWSQRFYHLLNNFKFVPGGRILSNAGSGFTSTLVNCFVSTKPKYDIDSLEGICEILRTQILTLASEGGYGVNFGFIRPRGGYIKARGIRTPGAVKYMELFDKSSEIITEGAGDFKLEYEETEGKPKNEKKKIRKGAQIFLLPIWHPDIIEFIEAKRVVGRLTKANLSVQVTNDFMERLNKVLATDKSDPNYDKLNKWELIFPDTAHPKYKTEWYGNIKEWKEEKGLPVKVFKTLTVTGIWEKIMKSTYDFNDPGVLFTDIANATNCANYLGKEQYIEASNPCVLEGTYVNTPNGMKKVETLKEGDIISTLHPNGYEPIHDIQVTENVPVYKVCFSDGGYLNVTASHQFHTLNKKSQFISLTKVKDLKIGDKVRVIANTDNLNVLDETSENFKKGLLAGILVGNGCHTEKAHCIKICSSKDDIKYNKHIISLLNDFNLLQNKIDESKDSKPLSINLSNKEKDSVLAWLGLEQKSSFEKTIPEWIYTDYQAACGFLNGIIAIDGNVNLKVNHPQIRIKTTSSELAVGLRRLLTFLGIHALIHKRKKENISAGSFKGHKLIAKHDQYELRICGLNINQTVKIAYNNINPKKQKLLRDLHYTVSTSSHNTYADVVSIEENGKGRVYDLHCLESDTWITEGYVQRGCGEITMSAGGSCLLSSWNFTAYIKIDQVSHKPFFDFKAFAKDIPWGLRFMDNIASLTEMPLPEYKSTITEYRRLGMGFMGLGSALMILGYKYGSKESVEFTDKVLGLMNAEAIKTSIKLAKERGAYKNCDWQKHLSNVEKVFSNLPSKDLEEIKALAADAKGFRNVALFTVPPTGNTGCLANNVSGGVEPIFALTTYRLVGVPEIPEELKDKCPKFWEGDLSPNDFFKEKEMWGFKYLEYKDPSTEIVYKITRDRGLCKEVEIKDYAANFIEANNLDKSLIDESSTAMNLNVDAHINILNIVAKHLDQSCSKTVNLPEDYKYEAMKNLYLNAYNTGRIKGITTFRSGTRLAVLTTEKTESKDCPCIKKTNAIKRPKELPCKLHLLNIKGISYYVIVSLLEEDPYEVFMSENSQPIIENAEVIGNRVIFKSSMNNIAAKLIKKANKQYVFITDDGFEYQISRKNETDDHATITGYSRLLSTALRHGTPIKYLVEQMEKTEGSFAAPVKVIARVLKKYIKDGEEIKGEVCPECGGKLVRKEGCKSCPSCGWSACG